MSETKPERQCWAVEDIDRISMLPLLPKFESKMVYDMVVDNLALHLQSERLISDKLREDYDALLDKVQLIETERDATCKKLLQVEAERDELKKRVDSEYNKGIADSVKVAEDKACRYMNPQRCEMEKDEIVVWPDDCPGCRTAKAILKLRRM